MHRWIVPVAAVLFLAACIASLVFWESCDVELLARDGVRYAIVKRGGCLDTSVGFWVSDGDGWLSYYLDYEVFRWENYSSRFVGDLLEVRKNGSPVASYDPRTKVFTSLDPKGKDVLPGERIWKDGKGSVHLATVKGKEADVLYPDQELTASYPEVDVLLRLEKLSKEYRQEP